MMRVASLVAVLVLPLLVHAQRLSHPVMVSRDDAFSSPAAPLAGPDTVRVLALMVQFQKDNDERTTGNGQFDLTVPSSAALDAPPHDAAYFRNHLLFLQNYFARASKGKLVVVPTLIDQVVTLPTVMGTYSPEKGGTNLPVAALAVDSWHAADSLHLVPDFSAYNAFVVLHAGAGRDIDLAGQLGYDPTPLDIPSLYLGLKALKGFYGQAYQGIPVSGGAFHITNSLVVPETETRSIPTLTGDAPFYLSINGLLCASLGSYLGLPDLFNTATGASGIGRFGLMDGQSIFSYNGAFPPEPSAWEKYFLGWVTPIVAPPGTTTLSLPAVALADSIYRIPINGAEYFLVENRNRDPLRTGQTVTSVYNGVTKQQKFARDTVGFDGFRGDFEALSGVITDVTSFDWSLPGAVDETDGTFYDGGVLIWHIDESVIARTIDSDAVNANPARRGVNLLEADGSQDIGQSYGLLQAGSGSEAGTPLDYWFQGNSAPVYKNALSPTTLPNSNSNTGANSHVTVRDFSARGPRMSAVVVLGDPAVTPMSGFPKRLGQQLSALPLAVGPETAPNIFVSTGGTVVPGTHPPDTMQHGLPARLYAWTVEGKPALSGGDSSGIIARTQSKEEFFPGPVLADVNRDGLIDCLVPVEQVFKGFMRAFTLRDVSPVDSLADLLFESQLPRGMTGKLMVADSLIGFVDFTGIMNFARFDGSLIDTASQAPTGSAGVAGISQFTDANTFVVTHYDGTVDILQQSPSQRFPAPVASKRFKERINGPAATAEFRGAIAIAFATSDGYLYLVDRQLNPLPGFPVNTGGPIFFPPALADIDGDGSRDLVVLSGSRIYAYSYIGASLDHFPVSVQSQNDPAPHPYDDHLVSNPVVADLDGDGRPDIAAVGGNGVVAAVDRDGKMVRGFPLAAGQASLQIPFQSAAAFRTPDGKIGLVVATPGDGTVTGWITGTAGASWVAPWSQYQKDARHSGFDGSALTPGTPVTQEFFPAGRAYNWPNPVYDGITHIRYYIKENATVRIRIFDLAGDLVASMPGPGVGGMDNEVEWKVGGVQSGVYFARIEASGAGGSGVNIVKVAVVK